MEREGSHQCRSIVHGGLRMMLILLLLFTMSLLHAKGEVIDSVTLHLYMYVPERIDVGFDEHGTPFLDTNAEGDVEMRTYATNRYGGGHEVIVIEHI